MNFPTENIIMPLASDLDSIIRKVKEEPEIGIPIVNRDFRLAQLLAADWLRVTSTPGEICILETAGGGMFTRWYFYHSAEFAACYIVWITEQGGKGIRSDIDRIQQT